MKRFFPSSVMLTPFLVKHYQQDLADIDQSEPVQTQNEHELSGSDDNQPVRGQQEA
ncbi:hypothetical protein [Vibrio sinaloensis]|uniref:hypothetical protein n=1 Tax=Photobacterium sp. (strain ATCC 43367) TaxID=379097 RepID=UPI0020709D5F|nr:hypothetical protein [Vibrio sinaloensis]UPQ90085.1 hypothetical protein MTO69_15095 [Vibrio sinaloensis]